MLRRYLNFETADRLRWVPIFLMFSVVLVAGCGSSDEHGETASGEEQLFSCGMHPQVIQDEPGNCPLSAPPCLGAPSRLSSPSAT